MWKIVQRSGGPRRPATPLFVKICSSNRQHLHNAPSSSTCLETSSSPIDPLENQVKNMYNPDASLVQMKMYTVAPLPGDCSAFKQGWHRIQAFPRIQGWGGSHQRPRGLQWRNGAPLAERRPSRHQFFHQCKAPQTRDQNKKKKKPRHTYKHHPIPCHPLFHPSPANRLPGTR